MCDINNQFPVFGRCHVCRESTTVNSTVLNCMYCVIKIISQLKKSFLMYPVHSGVFQILPSTFLRRTSSTQRNLFGSSYFHCWQNEVFIIEQCKKANTDE